MTRRRIVIGTLLAFAAQSLMLGAMIARQAVALRQGETLILTARPADPRDPLLGFYLEMEFPISRVAGEIVRASSISVGERVYAILEKGEDQRWQVASLHRKKPPYSKERPVLRARIPGYRQDDYRALYGIERYYLPQDEAKQMEKKLRDGELQLEIAVSRQTGQSFIRRLLVKGEPVYEDPLF